ncbi:unnamed protein product [Rangifer tarandus platyrhynchus]|uniref:Uncharacterized protein n=2 Tax=Rangifer tarandus platyrhynchus TaxID=3082113 RepID=A0ABN8Z1A3_RANTA|nr:unnamed protein product [Rangifer tarandus platyrhynchus]
MNVQHKLCEAMKEKEGPKCGTEKTLQYAGKALVCSECQVQGRTSDGLRAQEVGSLLTQQMSRAGFAAELPVFFALKKGCQHFNFTNLPVTHIYNWYTSNFRTMHIL